MTRHDPDSFIREHGVDALRALLAPALARLGADLTEANRRRADAEHAASLFPPLRRLPGGRLPNGADAATYYAGDVPESPETDRLAAAWIERCDALQLQRLRRRCASGEADRDTATMADQTERRRAEEWARQLAAITTARSESGTGDVIDRASRYIATCEGGESGSGRNPQAWGVVLRVTRGYALSPDVAVDLLAREYAPRCRPTLPLAELRGMVRRAMRYSAPEWGYLLNR